MPTIFKKCPNCGRRFEVKHVGEKLEKSERQTETVETSRALSSPGAPYVGRDYGDESQEIRDADSIDVQPGVGGTGFGGIVRGKEDVAIEEDTYLESYKCSHCGHEWTEEVVKDKSLGRV